MIIAFEGLEGVGKTTLSNMVCEYYPALYLKSPPVEFNPSRQFIAGTKSNDTNFYFYLSGLTALKGTLDKYKASNQHVIVDRYIHSTIAYHAGGFSFENPIFNAAAIAVPDVTVHIVCSETDRKKRQEMRGFHIFDRPICNEDAIKKYFSNVADFEFINRKSVEASALELCSALRNWFSK